VKPMTGITTSWETGEHAMTSSFRLRIDEQGLIVSATMRPSGAAVLGEVLNCSESIEVGP
jgi:hypothetical protein